MNGAVSKQLYTVVNIYSNEGSKMKKCILYTKNYSKWISRACRQGGIILCQKEGRNGQGR